MTKRKLSFLQLAYREFFGRSLAKYDVETPAKLDYQQKMEFFTGIREGWKIKKAELLKIKAVTNTSNYFEKTKRATAKVYRSSVTLEPNIDSSNRTLKGGEEFVQGILSEKNPDQTDELRIHYHPNQFFEQDEPYSYPVVKMPKEDSFLKLPRKGRANRKGYKEYDFYRAILTHIPEIEVEVDLHMAIPFFNRPYEPDLVLIDRNLNLYIDIEIDEPYDGYYRFPRHEVEKDETRDLFFTESGWIVIRFTEHQIQLQVLECIAYIKDVLNSIHTYSLQETSSCASEPQWNYQQAVRWEKERYRERYLGIESFEKQKIDANIHVDVEELDGIESNLNRTKKFKTATQLDNIAFEDETHKYHHPKDQTGNAEYISVTTLIDRFFPFDIDRFIQIKAEKEGRSKSDVLEEFIRDRDEAADRGTSLHEHIENFLKGKSYDSNTKEFKMFLKFHEEIIKPNSFEFIEAEKRILVEEYNIAGTIDALFKKPNSEEYIIVDWKRSKNLVIDGRPKKYGYGYGMSELGHLDNSSYYKYALQQNIYRYILQEKYGISISSMNLIVLHENFDRFFRINLGVMEREVLIIFNSINHKI